MVKNILPAVLVGFIRNFEIEKIREALHAFKPSPLLIPGRMNLFHFKEFDVMIDYAHNKDGFLELRNVGSICAQMFDKTIIRHDTDLRGRSGDEITALIRREYTVRRKCRWLLFLTKKKL